jgi:hypothetical protein
MLNTAFNQRLDQLDGRYKRRLRTRRHQALLVAAMILMILMILLEACTQSPDGHRLSLRDSCVDSHHVEDTVEVPEGLPLNHFQPTTKEVQS